MVTLVAAAVRMAHNFEQGSQSDPLGAAQHGGQAVGGQDLAGAGFHPPMGGLFVGRGCRLGAGGSVSALMYAIKAKLTVLSSRAEVTA